MRIKLIAIVSWKVIYIAYFYNKQHIDYELRSLY